MNVASFLKGCARETEFWGSCRVVFGNLCTWGGNVEHMSQIWDFGCAGVRISRSHENFTVCCCVLFWNHCLRFLHKFWVLTNGVFLPLYFILVPYCAVLKTEVFQHCFHQFSMSKNLGDTCPKRESLFYFQFSFPMHPKRSQTCPTRESTCSFLSLYMYFFSSGRQCSNHFMQNCT